MEDLSGDPNYSTVRTQLRVLEEKGHVRHEEHGLRYVYEPAVPRSSALSPNAAVHTSRSIVSAFGVPTVAISFTD
jgi:predicted transcriptional regulator